VRYSPKVAALLRELDSYDPAEKVVVFSQFSQALSHVSVVLKLQGIKHVAIVGTGTNVSKKATTSGSSRAEAVRSFNTDPKCRVFLLHASTAAAGLTLTVARRMVLLEPFLKAGEEVTPVVAHILTCPPFFRLKL
jgi:SNF2 family DNA or RNA helicase